MNLKLGYRNSRRFLSLMTTGLFLTLAILLGLAIPAVAAEPPDFTVDFPDGSACDFGLRVEGWGEVRVYKEFKDEYGNVVRTISGGKGYELLFTNRSTGATFSTKPNGALNQTTYNPDGSSKVTLTGHNIIFLFPTDVPAGPSTKLYVGRVVFTVDKFGNYTLQQVKAQTIDICAALSK